MTDCPLCRQPVPISPLDVLCLELTEMQDDLLRCLWEGGGRPVTTPVIFDALWAWDPEGGPSVTKMYRVLAEAVDGINARLAAHGVSVQQDGKRGYRVRIALPVA